MLVLSNLVSNYYYYTRLNGLFFRTTWVSQYRKVKPVWMSLNGCCSSSCCCLLTYVRVLAESRTW